MATVVIFHDNVAIFRPGLVLLKNFTRRPGPSSGQISSTTSSIVIEHDDEDCKQGESCKDDDETVETDFGLETTEKVTTTTLRTGGLEKIDCISNPHSVKCKLLGLNMFGLVTDNISRRPFTSSPRPLLMQQTLKMKKPSRTTKKPISLMKLKKVDKTSSTTKNPLKRRRPFKPRKKGKILLDDDLDDDLDNDIGGHVLETPETMCDVGADDCDEDNVIRDTIKTITPADCSGDNCRPG